MLEVIIRGNFPECMYADEAKKIMEKKIREALEMSDSETVRFEHATKSEMWGKARTDCVKDLKGNRRSLCDKLFGRG